MCAVLCSICGCASDGGRLAPTAEGPVTWVAPDGTRWGGTLTLERQLDFDGGDGITLYASGVRTEDSWGLSFPVGPELTVSATGLELATDVPASPIGRGSARRLEIVAGSDDVFVGTLAVERLDGVPGLSEIEITGRLRRVCSQLQGEHIVVVDPATEPRCAPLFEAN
jgi:hypothetical protein